MKTGTGSTVRTAVLGCALMIASVAGAQPESSGKGFLFGAPSGWMSLRGGYAGASAGSDIFSFVTSELSLKRKDFSSASFAADIAWSIRPRVDLIFSIDADGMEKQS